MKKTGSYPDARSLYGAMLVVLNGLSIGVADAAVPTGQMPKLLQAATAQEAASPIEPIPPPPVPVPPTPTPTPTPPTPPEEPPPVPVPTPSGEAAPAPAPEPIPDPLPQPVQPSAGGMPTDSRLPTPSPDTGEAVVPGGSAVPTNDQKPIAPILPRVTPLPQDQGVRTKAPDAVQTKPNAKVKPGAAKKN